MLCTRRRRVESHIERELLKRAARAESLAHMRCLSERSLAHRVDYDSDDGGDEDEDYDRTMTRRIK